MRPAEKAVREGLHDDFLGGCRYKAYGYAMSKLIMDVAEVGPRGSVVALGSQRCWVA